MKARSVSESCFFKRGRRLLLLAALAITAHAIKAQNVETLTVLPDRTGPKMIAAILDNQVAGAAVSFGSNTINVLFSEPINATSVRNTNNFTLALAGNTNTMPIVSVLYSSVLGALLNVDGSNPDWIAGGDYVLTANHVRDTAGNVIAPHSQIAVSRLVTTNVFQLSQPWMLYNPWFCQTSPGDWHMPVPLIDPLCWPSVRLPFCTAQPEFPCIPCTDAEPFDLGLLLLRTWFHWPASFPTTNVTLRSRVLLGDGDNAIFYLNGVEIGRYAPPPWTTVVYQPPPCPINLSWPVTNLGSGSNLLAVRVYRGTHPPDPDLLFGLELDVSYLVAPILSPEPSPRLMVANFDPRRLHLSWLGHGYALESTTNLSLGSASYPFGPWLQVSNMSNPFTNSLSEPARFFRLTK